ncbi:MAG: cellulase family glycosylhydrolase [Muribaculaceae bacterium]|nr:cellulase family glycosylhydrolase [Muribaculaceae bacterium]
MYKRLKAIAAALCATAAMWACSDKTTEPDPVPTPQPVEAYLTVETVSGSPVAAGGGEVTVTVKSHRVPTAKTSDSWVTRKSSDRKDDVATFIFTVAENTGAARTATITFTCEKLTATATIEQADGTPIEPDPIPVPSLDDIDNSVDYARALAMGWNLGNQFDAQNNGVASETAWGNQPTTPELFRALAAAGFRAVRIPITWLGHFGEAPDYTLDQAWLDRIDEVIGYAHDAGLRAIINIHHDGGTWLDIKAAANDSKKNEAVTAQIKAMWTQIAERFKDHGQFLMFEAFNEIHDGGWGWGDNRKDGGKQYATLNGWNQTFVDAVRATGGNNATRYLGIPGYCTNPSLTIESLVLPTDPAKDRLLVAVHFYDPTEFAINAKYTEWGHTGSASKKAGWGDEDNVTSTFDALVNKYVKSGTGVYVGECGATTRSKDRDELFRLYYLEYVWKAGTDRGLPLFFWDNGSTSTGNEAFGLFNHATGAFIGKRSQPAAEIMKKAYYTTDPAYTLQSVYAGAPK